jgi:hypothetical protein
MADFPNLKSGYLSTYPLVHETHCPTRILQFLDDSEQRFAIAKPLHRFTLTYHEIDGYDLGLLRTFWESMKGQYDATWQFAWQSGAITGCRFEGDVFAYTEGPRPGRFNVSLRVRQVDR